ncbi:uncharacterized protein [Physcomitrium patens]|uniref:uncharacterized protein n=1 Tax=Physcomitrium patens TaxID=3218 RepID=UPI003CCD23E5
MSMKCRTGVLVCGLQQVEFIRKTTLAMRCGNNRRGRSGFCFLRCRVPRNSSYNDSYIKKIVTLSSLESGLGSSGGQVQARASFQAIVAVSTAGCKIESENEEVSGYDRHVPVASSMYQE